MIHSRYLDALETICARLADTDLAWAVTGSLGLALQGVEFEVNDIDIQTSRDGAWVIEKTFSNHVVRPVKFRQTEIIRSYLGELSLNGVRVEVMGDLQKRLPDGTWEPPVDVQDHRTLVQLGDLRVPVLGVAYERDAYRLLGRNEVADKIDEFLERQHAPEG